MCGLHRACRTVNLINSLIIFLLPYVLKLYFFCPLIHSPIQCCGKIHTFTLQNITDNTDVTAAINHAV